MSDTGQKDKPVEPGKLLVLNVGTLLNAAQLLVLLCGGIYALANFSAEMAHLRDAVSPLALKVQTIDTTTQVIQTQQGELAKRVDRIESKIDDAAEGEKGKRL